MRFVLSHAVARARAIQAVKEAPEGYSVTIRPKGRSLGQNDLFHEICGQIAEFNGDTPESVKEDIKIEAFGLIDREKNGRRWQEIKSSAGCDTAEMKHLIDTAYRVAAMLGVTIYEP